MAEQNQKKQTTETTPVEQKVAPVEQKAAPVDVTAKIESLSKQVEALTKQNELLERVLRLAEAVGTTSVKATNGSKGNPWRRPAVKIVDLQTGISYGSMAAAMKALFPKEYEDNHFLYYSKRTEFPGRFQEIREEVKS